MKLIGELEDKLSGNRPFSIDFVRSIADKTSLNAFQLIKALNRVSNDHYLSLYKVLERINDAIRLETNRGHVPSAGGLVVPYSRITRDMIDSVGGKNATLGEIKNRIGLPVPDGFAIATIAYDTFMKSTGLYERIHRELSMLDLNDEEHTSATSKKIQSMIAGGDIPGEVLGSIKEAYNDLEKSAGRSVRLAIRSSSINEDSVLSFAGQYETMLNVRQEDIPSAYKQVIASMYCTSALFYLAHKGLASIEQKMSVGCMAMIDAKAAGIVYTKDPTSPESDTIVIAAVPGLGKSAVDGTVTPDVYTVDRSTGKTLKKQVVRKHSMLVLSRLGGIDTVVIDTGERQPCLDEGQIYRIAESALRVEQHYHCPQDMEWCVDQKGSLFILQSRQLNFSRSTTGHTRTYSGGEVLLDNCSTVCPGIGAGRAFVLTDERDIPLVPEGAILIAPHSSPSLVRAMDKVSAIITETGGIAGHMASMAREFNIPTITDAVNATSRIVPGEKITVDADSACVYRGAAERITGAEASGPVLARDTAAYRMLKKISRLIAPLHLTDPSSRHFEAPSCTTIHDITRYCHEKAIANMFDTCDGIPDATPAIKVAVRLPIDLYVLDIDGGTKGGLHKGTIKMENIASTPFYAFMTGMTHEGIRWWEPRRIDIRGFLSVLSSSAARVRDNERPVGERSLAAISKDYFNFNSRVGYHFSTIDAFCNDVKNNNYITFSFRGGASEDIRRFRRAKFLTTVLNELDFRTETRGDHVMAYFRKYDKDATLDKLDLLGRLTLCALHLDMLMTTDASVEWFTKAFLEGNYNFEIQRPL